MAHIAMLIPSLAGGGAERTTLRIAGGLAERGHRVDIVLFGTSIAYPAEIPPKARLVVLCGRGIWESRTPDDMPDGVVWRPERARLGHLLRLGFGVALEFPAAAPILLRRAALGRARRLARYFERERPDIVFANLPQAEYAAFYAARLVPVPPPIVPVARAATQPGTGHSRRRRLLFPAAAHIVAVSRGVAENISRVMDVSAERIAVIYNPAVTPAELRHAEASPPHPWFEESGPPVVLGVGRLAPAKDFLTLIDAFQRVLGKYPCRLLILGEGPMRAELQGRVRTFGLEDHVSLPGWVDNPYAFMARAALFVLSSRYEGFPGVLVEALACGCPSVSTDCPSGPSEILEDTDCLAPVGDPDALARTMLRALARPLDRKVYRSSVARFSMTAAIDGYEKLMSRLLAHGRGG